MQWMSGVNSSGTVLIIIEWFGHATGTFLAGVCRYQGGENSVADQWEPVRPTQVVLLVRAWSQRHRLTTRLQLTA